MKTICDYLYNFSKKKKIFPCRAVSWKVNYLNLTHSRELDNNKKDDFNDFK